jgi:hypothetical protein
MVLVLALFALLWLGGFVVFLDFTDFGEPVVFAVNGTHVADELVEVEILDVVVFVRHIMNIKIVEKEIPARRRE